MSKVRTRIAPSPTGFPHIGIAYTALFNFAFAKNKGGEFIIRLEDTDVKREVVGAEGAIYEGLSWLGLSWDEGPDKGGPYGPYRQSERLEIYKKKAQQLIKAGFAYEDEGAIRFRNRQKKEVSWNDLIRGKISFPAEEIGDFVILKSDGFPTYNFGVVVDDVLMKISHVIRGEDHISNTPRQLVLYQAFDQKPPQFAHLPTLRNIERKKLSKRQGPVSIQFYKDEGYLPEALINFLMLLGWSHPDEKEIISTPEFIRLFDLERVRYAGPVFDLNKLDWMNGEYIRQLSVDELNAKLQMLNAKWKEAGQEKMLKIIPLVQDRIKKLSEFALMAGFFFERPKLNKKLFGPKYKRHLKAALEVLSRVEQFNNLTINEQLQKAAEVNSFKTGDFFMDIRVALTGSRFTPPVGESIEILGKDETLDRIRLVS